MKTNKFILLVLLSGLFSQSCKKGLLIEGKGSDVKESRPMASFSALDLTMDADVSYIPDSVYLLELTGQKNVLDVLETKVDGGELKIDLKKVVLKKNKIHLAVHCPLVNKITISGSGNVLAGNGTSAGSLDLIITGSGNITVSAVSLQSLSAKISGSGNITINSGSSASTSFDISGSGNISSESVAGINGNASISGSGNITMNISQSLGIKISGSGDIHYRGNPQINSDITGSGKLIHLD